MAPHRLLLPPLLPLHAPPRPQGALLLRRPRPPLPRRRTHLPPVHRLPRLDHGLHHAAHGRHPEALRARIQPLRRLRRGRKARHRRAEVPIRRTPPQPHPVLRLHLHALQHPHRPGLRVHRLHQHRRGHRRRPRGLRPRPRRPRQGLRPPRHVPGPHRLLPHLGPAHRPEEPRQQDTARLFHQVGQGLGRPLHVPLQVLLRLEDRGGRGDSVGPGLRGRRREDRQPQVR
mmetsp:Transcript_6209/g.15101  ORF Transcript_6209/g.15101 Transcript_6209/m.15101 type:complete len:229 (-) Transcript_6209:588-1274(-)